MRYKEFASNTSADYRLLLEHLLPHSLNLTASVVVPRINFHSNVYQLVALI